MLTALYLKIIKLIISNQVHTGVKGFVKDNDDKPLEGASISVSDRQHPVTTAADGDYWRLLVPGSYEIQASCEGYKPQRKVVEVHSDKVSVLNFNLKPSHDDGEVRESYTGVSRDCIRFITTCQCFGST